jgi:uncharacterized membrane protein YdjX (TVP38/TMEM64 family)
MSSDVLDQRKSWVLAIVFILLIGLAWYVNNYTSLDELVDQEEQLRQAIALNPWRAFFIGFGVYTGLSFIPGTPGKGIVFGWLFGLWQALIVVTIGLTLAAMVIFSLSRYLFQERIERSYTAFLTMMNNHLEKEGAFYLVTLRLLHFPYSILNPVSGASRVSTWTFFWTTVVGLFPSNIIWIYVGVRLPSLRELEAVGASALIDPPLLAALVASAGLPFLFRRIANRYGISASQRDDASALNHEG